MGDSPILSPHVSYFHCISVTNRSLSSPTGSSTAPSIVAESSSQVPPASVLVEEAEVKSRPDTSSIAPILSPKAMKEKDLKDLFARFFYLFHNTNRKASREFKP